MSGPLLIGPTPLTVNTPVQVKMSAETHAIYVQNYSRFTVLVSFSDVQPTARDSMNNQYDGVLQAGGRDVFYVQSRGASAMERSLNAMGAFTGSVWFMPIDRTVNQSNTGSVSQLNDLWVSAYGPNDPPPPFPGGMPLNVDLSSQPRVVCVPMGLSHWNQGIWLAGGAATVVLQTATPSAAQLASTRFPIYLYYANMFPETGVTGSMSFTLEVQWQTAGSVNVGTPFVFARGVVAANNANQTMDGWTFAPNWPLGYFGGAGNIPPTAAKALLQMTYQAGIRLNIDYTVSMWADPTNTQGDADIGVQTLFTDAGFGIPLF